MITVQAVSLVLSELRDCIALFAQGPSFRYGFSKYQTSYSRTHAFTGASGFNPLCTRPDPRTVYQMFNCS